MVREEYNGKLLMYNKKLEQEEIKRIDSYNSWATIHAINFIGIKFAWIAWFIFHKRQIQSWKSLYKACLPYHAW